MKVFTMCKTGGIKSKSLRSNQRLGVNPKRQSTGDYFPSYFNMRKHTFAGQNTQQITLEPFRPHISASNQNLPRKKTATYLFFDHN